MNIKISEMPQATNVSGNDIIPIVQSGVSKKVTKQLLTNYNYSSTEQVIGTWIDGKPLYRKTFVDTTASTSYQIDVSDLNIDFVAWMYGVIRDPNNVTTVASGFYTSSTTYFALVYNSAGLGVRTGSGYISCTKYITIEYTKTSD